MKLPKLPLKRTLLIGGTVVVIAGGAVTAALNQPQKTGADTSPLTTEVDRQGQELQNHEARITNAENDIKALQSNTTTAPATHQSIPPANITQVIVTTPPIVTPPAPITITKSVFDGNNSWGNCGLTYSDGTTAQVPAVLTQASGGFGVTITTNNCDSFVGQTKQ